MLRHNHHLWTLCSIRTFTVTFKGITLKIWCEVIHMIKGPRKSVSVALPLELYERVKKQAERTGRRVPGFIRQVVKGYL